MSYNRESFLHMLEVSVSPYHTVLGAAERLEKAGFRKLEPKGVWKLQPGESYYVSYGGSSLFAFVVGQSYGGTMPLRMAAAHTDFPCLVIKRSPDMSKAGCKQLNIEVYGGMILHTWMDRPLSAAGQVILRSDNPWKPQVRYVDIKKSFCQIPSLAIHMNREVNKGVELKKQVDMIPVAGLLGHGLIEHRTTAENGDGTMTEQGFLEFLAAQMQVNKEDILDYHLNLYATEVPQLLGMGEELVSACHLDNTTGVEALLQGILQAAELNEMTEGFNCASTVLEGIRLIALFDHEEIGSRSKQGAASSLLRDVLEKLAGSVPAGQGFWNGKTVEELLEEAMLLSVDVAHGSHPNHMEKMDPTNAPILGQGFCIKKTASQSYATDGPAIGILQQLCDRARIPWQIFMNRADEPGGGTLGAVAALHLPVPTVDLGAPILAMHSVRELMAETDMKALCEALCVYMTE